MGVVLSRIFAVAQVLAILYWATRVRRPFASAPGSYSLFVVFVIAHTFVTYGLLSPAELFVSDYSAVLGQEVEQIVSRAVVVAKFFGFVLFCYAVASMAGRDGHLTPIGLGLGGSLVVLLALGRSEQLVDAGGRYTGGYANANAFAEVCLAALFCNVYTLFQGRSGRAAKMVALILVAASAGGLLMSASRSALMAILVGMSGVFAVASGRHRVLLIAIAVAALTIVMVISPQNAFELVYRRSTESLVNLRSLIWGAYLQQWREYVPFGVGLGREMTALSGPIFMDRIWPPHNTVLQVTVAYGVLGPVALLAIMLACIRRAWSRARCVGGVSASAIALGLVLTWMTLMFTGDRLGARVFWVMLGMVFAILAATSDTGQQEQQGKEP
jgi:O-antigen ligase